MVSVFFRGKKVQPSLAWLFYAGLFLYLLSGNICSKTALASSAIDQIQTVVGRLGAGLLFLRLLTLFRRHPFYVLACCCMLAALKFSYVLTGAGSLRLYRAALVVSASRGADPKTALKVFLAYLVFFLVICPGSFFAGWAGNVVKHIGECRGSSYGFGNPNILAVFLAMAVILGLYLSKERRAWVLWAICWSAAALTFLLTLCRTQTLILLALPVIDLVFRRKMPKPGLVAVLPVLCLAVSVVLAGYYGPGYGSTTFESRFSAAALLYERFGLSPFGQDCGLFGWFKGEYPYNLSMDNGYLNLFLCRGVVIGIVVMAFLVHLFFLIGKKGDRLLVATACCFAVMGMMECYPFLQMYSFLPLFYIPLVEEYAPARVKTTATVVPFVLASGVALYLFMPWHPQRAVPHPDGTVGDIACPAGFAKAEFDPDSFSGFVEGLPLARPDSVVTGFDGERRDTLAQYGYRVVDFPLIDLNEQCADVCMRLRAEYLYRENRFLKIRFADTRGQTLRYRYGACRPLFDRYLKEVFAWSNTESMCSSMPVRPMEDIVPGDVFVYEKDARPDGKYGHAVMVAAVAIDTVSARKAVLLIQGSTPACDLHVVANLEDPGLSPWHLLPESGETSSAPVLSVGNAVFYAGDLRRF